MVAVRRLSGKKTVLVVDDDPDILSSLASFIGGRLPHVSVMTMGSGPKAVALLNAQPIDLIITDYKMAEMDGVEFLRLARQVQADIPMVIMTAYSSEDLADRAFRVAAVRNIIQKPFDVAPFIKLVEDLLSAQDVSESSQAGEGMPSVGAR